jgi:hypothetical protein
MSDLSPTLGGGPIHGPDLAELVEACIRLKSDNDDGRRWPVNEVLLLTKRISEHPEFQLLSAVFDAGVDFMAGRDRQGKENLRLAVIRADAIALSKPRGSEARDGHTS